MTTPVGTPMPRTTCPHCRRDVGNRHFDTMCPSHPDAQAVIGRLLANPAAPGVARSTTAYMEARAAYQAVDGSVDVPNAVTLSRHYGTWPAACAHFGLITSSAVRVDCPYCRQSFSGPQAAYHSDYCPDNPALRPLMWAALTDGCAPGEAVGVTEYSDRRLTMTPMPPDENALCRWAGTYHWEEVLAKLGLVRQRRTCRPAVESERFKAVSAQVEMEAEAAARALAAERYGTRGFAVCAVRDVPGLRINGRPAVACVLR
jgi:hypothetical protein